MEEKTTRITSPILH